MKNHFILLIVVLCVISCEKEEVTLVNASSTSLSLENNSVNDYISPAVAYPDKEGELIRIPQNDGSEVVLEKYNNEYVMSGDIILTSKQVDIIRKNATLMKGAAIESWRNFWPKSRVYYTISSSLPNPARVTQAIAHYQATLPHIEFIERTFSSQRNYIEFVPGSGCSSKLGMVGGRQTINLAPNCDRGTVIHEIGHALGLFHEQSRTDRDNHIIINWGNIKVNKWSQFTTYSAQERDGFNFGNFDFNSIMLYPSVITDTNFVHDTNVPAITRIDGSEYSHNRTNLSTGDRAILNHIYGPPFVKMDIEDDGYYEQDGYDIESTYHLEFYQDKNYTTRYYLPSSLRINYTLVSDQPSGVRKYVKSKTLSAGNYRYYFVTVNSSCHYDYGNPEPGCEDNSIYLNNDLGYTN